MTALANYATERAAYRAMARFLKRYPLRPEVKVEVVSSTSWLYPFRYLIRVTTKEGAQGYMPKRTTPTKR